MRVDVHVREHILHSDYPASEGRDPTSLELLLASLASCAANTLHLVLNREMGMRPDSIEVEVRAERRAEHPTILNRIEMRYGVQGEGLRPELIDQAVRLTEDKLCPVFAMLRPGTEIHSTWTMEEAIAR